MVGHQVTGVVNQMSGEYHAASFILLAKYNLKYISKLIMRA